MGRFSWGLAAAAMLAVTPLAACSSEPEPVTAVFLGDSDTIGTALPLQEMDSRWPSLVAKEFGWREVNAGCDGSGYTQAGMRCMTTYRESVARYVDEDPDVVVISGGVSDLGATPGEIEAAVRATFITLREAFPDAQIYAMGALAHEGPIAPEELRALNATIESEAAQIGATYVNIGEPLLDRPDLLADGVHPNADGHAVIAELTSNEIGGTD